MTIMIRIMVCLYGKRFWSFGFKCGHPEDAKLSPKTADKKFKAKRTSRWGTRTHNDLGGMYKSMMKEVEAFTDRRTVMGEQCPHRRRSQQQTQWGEKTNKRRDSSHWNLRARLWVRLLCSSAKVAGLTQFCQSSSKEMNGSQIQRAPKNGINQVPFFLKKRLWLIKRNACQQSPGNGWQESTQEVFPAHPLFSHTCAYFPSKASLTLLCWPAGSGQGG